MSEERLLDQAAPGELDLGLSHYARWFRYGDEGAGHITVVANHDQWEAGGRGEAGTRKVSILSQPQRANGDRAAGVIIRHPAATDSGWCEGAVTFWEPEPSGRAVWTLHCPEPLHIEPSVLCSCGDHGFVRDGKWVAA